MSTVNQKIFKVHSWLGLVNGLWMLILGISGSILVYSTEIDRFINKDILTVTALDRHIPVDSLYLIVKAKHPEALGTNITHFPINKSDCISFRVYVEDGSKPMSRWSDMYNMDIDPHTGKVLREGAYSDISKSFLFWVATFHWNLNYGPVGTLIITLAGILLFINIITGIIIYRKYFLKALIFKAPVKWKNWSTITSGLHRYIGVWAVVCNLLIFYSGLQMTWGALDRSYYQKPIKQELIKGDYASLDKMISDVQKIYPGFEIHYFYIPFRSALINGTDLSQASAMGYIPGTPSIIPLSNSTINFDINTGVMVSKVNANDEVKTKNLWGKFNYIAYSFHAGTFAGAFSRVLWVIAGLTPAFLAISGFMLWWRRSSKKKITSSSKKSTI